MSGFSPVDAAADGIEQGRRLIRLGGDKGLSLAERLSNRFNRLTWRTPLHTLRLRGRFPLKLIAVPADPIPGDATEGQAIMDGVLRCRGTARPVEELDFAHPDAPVAFIEHLHSFAWLRDIAAAVPRKEGAAVAEGMMRLWLAAHAETVADPAWRYDVVGKRLLNWTAHAPLILSSGDLIYRSLVLNTLARQARHLDRGAERAPQGVPRIAAWCGVIAAGLLIPGGDPRRQFGEAGLIRTLSQAVFDDGGLIARSPVAQLEAVALLAQLRAVYDARREELPAPIQTALNKMVPALLGVVHGDGGLSSWQGGAPIDGDSVRAVIAASGVRARPLRQARDWGYQRMAAADTAVILDAAPPPVARLAEGGCASTLAFELSDGPRRLIVNCGGARMASPRVPAHLCEGLRTTAAHSTLILKDSNSTAIHADGTLGRGVSEVELDRQESEGGSRIEASHDGYLRRFGFLHRRVLTLTGDGRELRGEDLLLPAPKTRRKPEVAGFAIRFHLAPGVEASPTADGQGALLRLPDGPLWQFRAKGAGLSMEESLWIDGAGRPRASWQMLVIGEAPAGGASVNWALRRMG